MDYMKIVIVGHVDHGKSTLIGRLFFDTGCLPEEKIEEVKKTCEALGREMEFAFVMDHLEEERTQGITIDTAQTFFKTDKRNYVIIDAPGHKEFIKNMVTGASQAETAILIVDAEEGVREQTKRHAYILGLLGLEQVIVVINKMDLVDYREEVFNNLKDDVISFLMSINIKPSFVIPISAKKGDFVAKHSERMKWYSGLTVLQGLDTFKTKPGLSDKPLRFAVQDIYKIDGKRITAGRVETGVIKQGDSIVVLPSGNETTVKSIEEFGKDASEAIAGKSTGITTTDPIFLDRGNIVCHKDSIPKTTKRFKANVFWMSKDPLRKGEKITMKCATQEVSCTIEEIERKFDSSSLENINEDLEKLNNTEVGEVVIVSDSTLVLERFNDFQKLGRFVFERNDNACAGGIITVVG
ncbi:MAG: sulfate adenylyltransferase subunit 1 [Candidatus Aenigmatarchaeota archaeon]